jgi:hypothetical protein
MHKTKRIIVAAAALAFAFFLFRSIKDGSLAKLSEPPKKADLLICDFEKYLKSNNLGLEIGTWDKDPSDKTQSCKSALSRPGYNKKSGCMKITYDVDSPEYAFNGYYVKLGNLDATEYKSITFWAKGDPKKFKIELKNSISESSSVYVSAIPDKWQKIELPFSAFKGLTNISKLTEFVIVFEDIKTTPKTGILYLDDIALSK